MIESPKGRQTGDLKGDFNELETELHTPVDIDLKNLDEKVKEMLGEAGARIELNKLLNDLMPSDPLAAEKKRGGDDPFTLTDMEEKMDS